MVVDFSKIDLREPPMLILKNTTDVPIGVLGYAMNITADIKYDEASVIEFNLPAQVDGEPTPYYDAVIGMRIVELQNIGQFILVNPKETGDGVKKIKACKGYSLEYEFTFKKLSLANATYNFWNPVTPDSTLLGIILELMPSWCVGSIDNNLVGKYLILKVSDETTGKTSYVDGKVDYVMYQEDGSQMLSVNNKLYSIDTLDTVADSDYYEAIGYAKTISNMLAQLPDIENITTKYSGAIEQIRKVYDGMTDYQKSFVSESDLAKLKKYEQKIKDLGGDTSDDTKTDDTKTDTDTKTDDTKTDTDTKTDDTKTDDSKTENGSDQKSDETTGA